MNNRPRRSTSGWVPTSRQETVKEMLARCREADTRRIADGSMNDYLAAQAHGLVSLTDWRERFFTLARKRT
jgi:hypothetical protein